MATLKLSSKYQITIPMEMVRKLNLKAGDRLVAELVDDHIVLLPEPENWIKYFSGRLAGVWGDSVEEIDRRLAEDRASYERDEWLKEFDDILGTDKDAKEVVEYLVKSENYTSPEGKLLHVAGIGQERAMAALGKLTRHGAVRRIPAPPGIGAYRHLYRLVPDFVRRLKRETVSNP